VKISTVNFVIAMAQIASAAVMIAAK